MEYKLFYKIICCLFELQMQGELHFFWFHLQSDNVLGGEELSESRVSGEGWGGEPVLKQHPAKGIVGIHTDSELRCFSSITGEEEKAT